MNIIHIYGLNKDLDLLEKDPSKLAESLKKLDEAFKTVKREEKISTIKELKKFMIDSIFKKIEIKIIEKYQKIFEDTLENKLMVLTQDFNLINDYPTMCENLINTSLAFIKKNIENGNIQPVIAFDEISKIIDNELNEYITWIEAKVNQEVFDKNYEFTYDDVVELYKNNLLIPKYIDGELESVNRRMANGEEIKLNVDPKYIMDINSFLRAAYRNPDNKQLDEAYRDSLNDKMYKLTYNDVVYLHNIGEIYIRNGGYYREFENDLLLLRVVKKDAAQILKFLEERYSKNLGKVVKNYNQENIILTLEDIKYLYDNKKLIIKMLTETEAHNFRVTVHVIGYTIKRLVDDKPITLVMAEEDVKDIKQFITEKYGWGYKQYE